MGLFSKLKQNYQDNTLFAEIERMMNHKLEKHIAWYKNRHGDFMDWKDKTKVYKMTEKELLDIIYSYEDESRDGVEGHSASEVRKLFEEQFPAIMKYVHNGTLKTDLKVKYITLGVAAAFFDSFESGYGLRLTELESKDYYTRKLKSIS